MSIKERVTQALWGGAGDAHSPEDAHPPAATGCFERPPPSRPFQPSTAAPQEPPEMAKALPDMLRASELEAALLLECQASRRKDEELALMHELLAKLEQSIEQQATDAKLEQERISVLERRLSAQHPGEQEEKVEKLLLAVAAERRRAEEGAQQLLRLQERLQEEESQRQALTEELVEKRLEIERLQAELAQRSREEEARARQAAEDEAQRRPDASRREAEASVDEAEERLDHGSRDADAHTAGAEAEVQRLRRQVAEELVAREALQVRLAEKERQIVVLQLQQLSSEDLERHRSAQEQLIEKEREVCELQEQLADELSKRREVQYQNIERERLVHEKDRLLQQLHAELAAERGGGLSALVGSLGSTRRSLGGISTATEDLFLRRTVSDDDAPPSEPARTPPGRSVPTYCGRVVVPPPCMTPRQKPELQQVVGGGGGGSLTFAAVPGVAVLSGQIRQRAYLTPGPPPWGPAATPPPAHQGLLSARRVSQASRTFG